MTTQSNVHVYWNRTLKIWSIRHNGIVVDRRPSLSLTGCVFHAGESARLRCLRTGDRDVHAWIKGTLSAGQRPDDAVRIGYRPAEPGFRRRDTDEVLATAENVWFEADGTAWAQAPVVEAHP